jgi:hypothetical protein
VTHGRAVEQQNPALFLFFGSEFVVILLRERGANTQKEKQGGSQTASISPKHWLTDC